MAKPGLAQDQTVEEILASIRQVINGDQSRAGAARPPTGVMPAARSPAAPQAAPRTGTVTPIHGGKVTAADEATAEDSQPGSDEAEAPTAAPADQAEVHDVIELAIEQALDEVNAGEARSETASSPAAEIRPPWPAARPQPAPQPPREAPRVIEAQAAREAPRMAEAQPVRSEAPRMSEPAARPLPPPASRTIEPTLPPASRSLLSPRANAAVAASFDDLAKVLAMRSARDIDQAVEDLLRPMLKSWLEDNLPSLVERLVREEIERVSRGGR